MLGRTVHTRIPTWENSAQHVQQATDLAELVEMDRTKKAKMKEYADRCQRAQLLTDHKGDWVFVRQEQKRKSASRYPLQIPKWKGRMATVVSDDKRVTWDITRFKKRNTPPKEAMSGVDSDVTKDTPTPATSWGPPFLSAVGEPTPSSSVSRPQRAHCRPVRIIE
ncbi:hypothetical protein NDU88_009861 [Pleurodeles waltl]|uniref:Uncharacterized protein n=1 Tax=Pleurodeles waltl TaxID=8319 RepID=A0AAV7Q0K1_PLEWA|nr:hypothetical protein NDU88_009861 [Pleurodeles waltl]